MSQYGNAVFEDGPIEVPWHVAEGDDWEKWFTIKVGGVVQDVSSWVWFGRVVAHRESLDTIAVIEWDTSMASTGRVGYHVNYPNTDLEEAGEFWYALGFKNPARRTFQHGLLVVQFDHLEMS